MSIQCHAQLAAGACIKVALRSALGIKTRTSCLYSVVLLAYFYQIPFLFVKPLILLFCTGNKKH